MSEDELKPREIPKPETSVNFGGVAGDAKFVAGDEIAEQNNVQGDMDKSQGKIDNTGAHIEGGQTNTTNVGGNSDYEKHFTDLLDNMTAAAPEITPEEIEQAAMPVVEHPEDTSFEPLSFEEFEESIKDEQTYENNEDHPAAVYASVQRFQESPPSQEEQKSLFSRAMSSAKKYATSDEAVALGKLALSGMEATASIAPPFNILAAVVKTGIALTGK